MTTPERLATIEAVLYRVETALISHMEWEELKYKDMDSRFASKWVEYLAVSTVIAGIGGVITILLNLL
jgi:hypothetical protein